MSPRRIYQHLIFGNLDPEIIAPDLARRIRHIHTVLILMIAVSLPFLVRAIEWNIQLRVLGIGSGLLIAFALLFANPQRKNLSLVGNLAIFALVCAVIPAVMTNAGFSGAATAWLCLLPLFGGFLVGYRSAVCWGIFAIAALLFFLIAESSGVQFLDATPPETRLSQRFLLYLGVTVSVFLVVTSFVSSIKESDRRFKNLIGQLEQEVTYRKQAELEARRASETKTQFLANVSHELRTPMNAIIGMTQLTLDTDLTEQQQHQMRVIDQSSRFLLNLINDILDLSKIEADKLDIVNAPFLFDEMIANLSVTTGFSAGQKNLRVYFDIDPVIPPDLCGDELRLSQILMNLLSNAVKFTKQGYIRLSVVAQSTSENEICIGFEVEDSGIGMKPDYVKSLFMPFSQADASITRQYGGTGLGLAITKRLVDLMGGRIRAESVFGQGSRFSLDLVFQRNRKESETSAFKDRFDHLVNRCRGMKAQLAVQDALQAEIVTTLLQSLGVSVIGRKANVESDDRSTDTPNILIVDDEQTHRITDLSNRFGIRQVIHLTYSLSRRPETHPGYQLETVPLPVCRSQVLTALSHLFLMEQAHSTIPTTEANLPLSHLHLLLVEDNIVNQEVARKILERAGAQVDIANQGLEALHCLGTQSYQAILMDVQMPVMDGIEATLRIRANEQWNHIPILGMSAHVHQSQIDSCINAGMSECISKPYRKEELFAALQRILL